MTKEYEIFDGIAFSKGTDPKVMKVISENMNRKRRVRIFFGDVSSGKEYCDHFDTCGYFGRSTGVYKIPLLIAKSTSSGGGAILDKHILKIIDTKTKEVLYCHPNHKTPKFDIIPSEENGKYNLIRLDNNNEVLFVSTKEKCEREKDFLLGIRMTP